MRETDLTQGSVFKSLIRFSLPMIAGNLLQQVYSLADTFIVGRFIGPDALACVGSACTLMIFLTSLVTGLCMGSGAMFSADYGGGNEEGLKEDIRLSFLFVLAVSAVVTAAVYIFTDGILAVLQTPSELMMMTEDYVRVVFAGIMFTFLYNFFAYLIRALGNSAVPLVFLGISSVLNIVLDIWFVAGLDMGVSGAAAATVISQAVSGIGIAVYALKTRPDLFRRGKRRAGRLREIILTDVATGIQQSVMNFGILMIQGLVNSFGSAVMASFAIAVKIDTIAYMPAQEFGNAYSLFVSQNYGAGQAERIRKGTVTAFLSSAVLCAAVSVMVCIFAEDLMGIFTDPEKVQIISEGARYLRIEGAMYAAIGILFLWYGYFRGIDRPQISLLLTVISLGTRVLLSYTLAPHTVLGVTAIWLSIPAGWILADISGYAFYRKNRL